MVTKILIFRIGSLGDNLVALPAIWTVRKNYPKAKLYLLGNRLLALSRVLGQEIFDGSDLFEGYFQYPVIAGLIGWFLRPFQMFLLLLRLRIKKFDTLVYLAPSSRTEKQINRDRLFFNLAGIRECIGVDGFYQFPPKNKNGCLPEVPKEMDLLLTRLRTDGLKTPGPARIQMGINLGQKERNELSEFLTKLPADGGRKWIGIGPGSNMPSKVWPVENFVEVIKRVLGRFNVWPVIFGGKEDKEIGDKMIRELGCGYNFAGSLRVRVAATALKRCELYLGNDTGTMHLAASVNTPCIAIFSSRDYPGRWYPYGRNHRVFRTRIACEGCQLVNCVEKGKECILSIKPKEVINSCLKLLSR